MTSVKRLCLAFVGFALFITPPLRAKEPSYDLDIEPQPLAKALKSFAEQSGLQVVYYSEIADGEDSPEVSGTMTADQAITQLLASTDLTFDTMGDDTVIIEVSNDAYSEEADLGNSRPAAGAIPMLMTQNQTSATQAQPRSNDEGGWTSSLALEEIIVTGTNIRGVAPDSAPVDIYTNLDIAKTGAANLEQFIFKLPQNLNSITSIASFATPDSFSGSNGVNLRGLGAGATLVLLNGKRLLAPGGFSPDISLIPLSAIERVEVLSDGASATYGSDAIGGVVNILLKDDVDGVDAGLSYGAVTSGDHDQFKADITAGTSWDSGNLTASYNFFDQSPLQARDRNFGQTATPYFLLLDDVRHSALGAIEQQLGDQLTLKADVLYSKRETQLVASRVLRSSIFTTNREVEQYFASADLTYSIDDNLTLDVFGTYSESEQDSGSLEVLRSDGSTLQDFRSVSGGDELEIGAKIDGALLDLPAGKLRFAAGGGYGEESFNTTDAAERDRIYGFGELFVPVVGPEQDIPGINRLELNGSVRYTDYSDAGSNTSPRIGLLLSPINGLNLRGTYSEAFRAPGLAFLLPNPGGSMMALFSPSAFGFPDPFSSTNSTVYLFAQGFNPNLGPETSQSFTVGFDVDRTGIEGLSLSGTYFNIDYVDRVSAPDSAGGFAAFGDPSSFPTIFNDNPSPELIAELTNNATNPFFFNTTGADITDLAAIIAVTTVTADNRLQNIASSKVEGLDFEFSYSRDMSAGELTLGGNLTYMLESIILPVPGTPIIDELNRPAQPVDLKFRTYAGIASGGFTAQVNLNYVDSYTDPFQTPEVPIDSWTTVDLSMAYNITSQTRALDGVQLSLNVSNLFDRDPPSLGLSNVTNIGLSEPVGFDPVNASPVGRFITFGVRKRFWD